MKRVGAIVVLLAVAAGAVVLSGVISVKASSGHLPPTAWLLDLVKRRSVAARAWPIDVPNLDDRDLVRLGAAHFETGCSPCHGEPGGPRPAVPARMTPHPPDLAAQIGRWQPRELFYLVAHGVKFTGMPAWPSALRTDEAWAVVAFLQRLPGLDDTGYRALVGDDGTQPRDVTDDRWCRVCHDSGSSRVPRLTGQSPEYLQDALDAYATGRRYSGVMQPLAAALDAAARTRLVTVFGARPDAVTAMADTGGGSGVIADGDPTRDVPACVECHGPGPRARDPRYPSLAGQPAEYLRQQLTLFAEGRRGGSATAEIMRMIAARLTPAQREEAARGYAALPPP